jgi:hypothetical protein
MKLDDCLYCEMVIDGGSSAIGLYDEPERAVYIPFVEDLRSSGNRLVHPVCFANRHGVQSLVDVIHKHDSKERADRMRALRNR